MLDAFPTNAAWWPKTSNRSTQRCVFHRATYKDVGMALNLNRLIVSAPPCIWPGSCEWMTEDVQKLWIIYALWWARCEIY